MSAALTGPSGRIPLGTVPLMMGYTPDNRLVVNDSQVSSICAIITASEQGYTITAVSNIHAVFINGQQPELHQVHRLHAGDVIRIDETAFIYEENQAASYTPPASTFAEANLYVYNTDEEVTAKEAPGMAGDVQVSSMPQVAAGPEVPVEQGPFAPLPVNKNSSGVQWPQYQVTGGGSYSAPPAPTALPFTPPVGSIVSSEVPAKAPAPPEPQNRTNLLKLLLVALTVVLVLVAGGSGTLIYQLTRPQPIIALSSQYMVGNQPVGAASTTLRVLGYRFSANSPITFLLDNRPVTGNPGVHSDGNGNFQANLPITSAWSVGMHKLMARDGGNYLATNVGSVRIVNQGEANTPGPHGAPPNNSTFTLKITLKQDNSTMASFTSTLTVMAQFGHDSATVCDEMHDNGQQWTSQGRVQGAGVAYTSTYTYACEGTYKEGKLSYSETLSSWKANYADGVVCQTTSPIVFEKLDGSFTSATTLSGTYLNPSYPVTCSAGNVHNTSNSDAITGTWTGTIA